MADDSELSLGNFRLRADACARLRIMSMQVENEVDFLQPEGRLLVCLDTNVIHLFLHSETNAHHVDPFGNPWTASMAGSRGRPRNESLLGAVAYRTGYELIFGAWREDVIALPAYDVELFDAVRRLRRDAAGRVARAGLQPVPKEINDAIVKLVSETAKKSTNTYQAVREFMRVLEKSPNFIDVFLPNMSSAARATRLFSSSYLDAHADARGEITTASLDNPRLFESIFDVLYVAKLERSGFADESEAAQIRNNTAADARALLQVAALSRYLNTKSKGTDRILFITTDEAIHRLVDSWYFSGSPPQGMPDYNFVRHPLQFTSLFGPPRTVANRLRLLRKDSSYASVVGTIERFDRFIRPSDYFSSAGKKCPVEKTDYGRYLYRLRYQEEKQYDDLPNDVDRSDSLGVLAPIAMRDLARQVSILQTVHSIELLEEVHGELRTLIAKNTTSIPNRNDENAVRTWVGKLVTESIDQLQGTIRALSAMIGWAAPLLAQSSSEESRQTVAAILRLASNRPADTKATAFEWNRMPVWLHFTEFQRQFFQALNESNEAEIIRLTNNAGALRRAEYLLANAFLQAAGRDWIRARQSGDEAAAYCRAALRERSTRAHKETEQISREIDLFRAVAIRHERHPLASDLCNVAWDLLFSIQKAYSELRDPRCSSELLALALSQHYHVYVYPDGDSGGRRYVPKADGRTIDALAVSAANELQKVNTELPVQLRLRAQTQFYCNIVLMHAFSRGCLGPNIKFVLEDPRLRIEVVREALKRAIEERDGRVSYFVKLIDLVADVLAETRPTLTQVKHWRERNLLAADILEKLPVYDRRKVDDLGEFFDRLSKSIGTE